MMFFSSVIPRLNVFSYPKIVASYEYFPSPLGIPEDVSRSNNCESDLGRPDPWLPVVCHGPAIIHHRLDFPSIQWASPPYCLLCSRPVISDQRHFYHSHAGDGPAPGTCHYGNFNLQYHHFGGRNLPFHPIGGHL